MQDNFNYPKIVESQENPEEELLLHSLENCDPYIFPHTIEWHRQEILKQLQEMENYDRKEALKKLNEELGKFINLRIELDSEEVRIKKKKMEATLNDLQDQAITINKLIGYTLITDPLTTFSFRQQQNQLSRNVIIAGFEESIIHRLNTKLKEILVSALPKNSLKYSNERLGALTQKIEKVNKAFHKKDGGISFIMALEKELLIKIA